MFLIWSRTAGCAHASEQSLVRTQQPCALVFSSPAIVDGWPESGNHGFQNQYHCLAATRCFSANLLGNLQVRGKYFQVGIVHLFLICWLMDPEGKKFGRGPRELTGAVDLMTHYKLLPHHEFFCKKSLPVPVVDTHYLHNVVGDTEIRKGEGMQLDQLVQNASYSQDGNTRIQPFDLDALRGAFHLKEMTPVELPSAEKGTPTIVGKSKSESKDKDKKHKRHKDRDKEKDKEHKKHKHRHKDRSKDKDKEKKKDRSGHQDSGGKHHEKKRKHDDDEDVNDIHRHKKSKVRFINLIPVHPWFVISVGLESEPQFVFTSM